MTKQGLEFIDLHEHSDERGRMRIVEVDEGGPALRAGQELHRLRRSNRQVAGRPRCVLR